MGQNNHSTGKVRMRSWTRSWTTLAAPRNFSYQMQPPVWPQNAHNRKRKNRLRTGHSRLTAYPLVKLSLYLTQDNWRGLSMN